MTETVLPLWGVAFPTITVPSFGLALFGEPGEPRIQHLHTNGDRIVAFERVAPINAVTKYSGPLLERCVGDDALFAFAFGPGSINIGERSLLGSILRSRRLQLSDFPFASADVAEFLEGPKIDGALAHTEQHKPFLSFGSKSVNARRDRRSSGGLFRSRSATATVALVSTNASLIDPVINDVADDTIRVDVHAEIGSLLDWLPRVDTDVVIIDDTIDHDARQLIRQLRQPQPLLYIAYVGARDEKRSIELLHSGADDAIISSSPSLVARLQAATRRARTTNAGARIAIGDIVFDRESQRVWCAGREVELTPHEYGVIDCLFWHTPRPVGVDTLSDFVWGELSDARRQSLVQVYVSYVRKKLAASTQVAIAYTKGVGYAFLPAAKRE